MLNVQNDLFQSYVNPKPSHDTIAWNTVTVRGLDGKQRAFRLYGQVRSRVVECDPEFPEFPVYRHRGSAVYGVKVLGFIYACDVCGGEWHVRMRHHDDVTVTPILDDLKWAVSFKTRADAVRAFAEAYIAAGN